MLGALRAQHRGAERADGDHVRGDCDATAETVVQPDGAGHGQHDRRNAESDRRVDARRARPRVPPRRTAPGASSGDVEPPADQQQIDGGRGDDEDGAGERSADTDPRHDGVERESADDDAQHGRAARVQERDERIAAGERAGHGRGRAPAPRQQGRPEQRPQDRHGHIGEDERLTDEHGDDPPPRPGRDGRRGLELGRVRLRLEPRGQHADRRSRPRTGSAGASTSACGSSKNSRTARSTASRGHTSG